MSSTLISDYIYRTVHSQKVLHQSVASVCVGVIFLLWSVFAGFFVQMLLPLFIAVIFNETVIVYAASQKANRWCIYGVCLLNYCAAITQTVLGFEMPVIYYLVGLFFTVGVAAALRMFSYKMMTALSGAVSVLLFGLCVFLPEVNGARNWLTLGSYSIQLTEIAKLFYVIFVGTLFLSRVSYAVKFCTSAVVTGAISLILLLVSEFGTMLIIATSYVCAVMFFFKGKAVYKILTALVVALVILLAILGYNYGSDHSGKWLCPDCSKVNQKVLKCVDCKHEARMYEANFKCPTCQYTTWGEEKLDNLTKNCEMCRKDGFLLKGLGKVCQKLYARGSVAYDYEFQKECGNAFHATQNLQAIESGGMFGNQKAIIYVPNVENDSVIAGMMNRLGLIFALIVLLGFFLVFLSITKVSSPLRFMSVCVFVFQAFYTFTGTINKLPMTGVGVPLLSDGGSNLVVSMCAICIMLSAIRNKEVIK